MRPEEIKELKKLRLNLEQIKLEANLIKPSIALAQKEYSDKLTSIKEIEHKIKKIDVINNIRIADHAIVRYFERVKGFNIKDIEKEILTQEMINIISQIGGSGTYPSSNGEFKVCMKNYTVTTII